MSTQGKGTYVINSGWSSGSLVFYEKAVGRTATGDVFTIGASQVTIGGTGQDVDFLVYLGSANNYFKLDCGAATAAFYGVDVTVTGDLTIASEDLALGDDCSLEFGASTDVTMTWLGSTNILAILPATDDTGAIQFGNGTKDMDVKIFLGSASNYVDFNVGDSQMALVGVDITTGSPVVITDATATSSTSTGALIVTGGIATAADITCGDDLFMSNGGVINFNAGNVTVTHSAGALACTGALTISIGTESTSTTTGALIVTGGIGFGGDMYVGDDVFLTSGAVLNFNAGNVTITHSAGALACTGALTVSIGTESTSTTTGALIVTGGIGFGGDMYVGDDIFLTSGAILSFDAGDVTLTHSANTLAIAGASVGVTADGPITVTVAALAVGDAYSGIRSVVTSANAGNSYGAAGYFETTPTGSTPTGNFLYGLGSWINIATPTTSGYYVCAQDNGVWSDSANVGSSRVIFGLRAEVVMSTQPARLCPFSINPGSNLTLSALFSVEDTPQLGVTTGKSTTNTFLPLFITDDGNVRYVELFS